MVTLTIAFIFATPFFDFVLRLDPQIEGVLVQPVEQPVPQQVNQTQQTTLQSNDGAENQVQTEAQADSNEATSMSEPTNEVSVNEATQHSLNLTPPLTEQSGPTVQSLLARRAKIARIHRIMGISTWVSMTGTVILGALQYINLYGVFADQGGNRCAQGNPFFGYEACIGTPVPHLVSAMVTSGLYYSTFGLSFAMPDPIGLDQGNSRPARQLRQHKRLRWAHFGGMASQIILGMFAANPQWLGLDRANDYRAMQAIGTVHLLSGYATYATLTWAGVLMSRH